MKRYRMSGAGGLLIGVYQAENEQDARDQVARDAGYKSEADMAERRSEPSTLVADETPVDRHVPAGMFDSQGRVR